MKLINTDGMAFIGPGSEWFWTALQFTALAITFIAIYRQLRSQRSASLYEHLTAWNQEFLEPRMVRNKLALLLEIEHRDPSLGFPAANDEVPDFFERLGYLVARGHVDPDDFWNDARPVVSFYWGVLSPYIEHDRAASGDPTIYRWFEWVEMEMRRIDVRRTGKAVVFDPATRASAIADRIEIFRSKLAREAADMPGPPPGQSTPSPVPNPEVGA